MSVQELLEKLKKQPANVEFAEVMAVIAENYHYQPTRFVNGGITNEAGSNEGSCKIFAFAKMHDLDKGQTLACFGKYYRDDVLLHPEGSDHANIRHFIKNGWEGLQFDAVPLNVL